MAADTNDESVVDVANDINGNTSDNATKMADDIIVDVDSNEDDKILGTVYLDGKRRSSRLSHVHGVFNLTIRRAIIDYGDTANNAIVKEIDQMAKKGVFEYIGDIPPGVEVTCF